MELPETQSIRNTRWILNFGAFAVVAILGGVFIFLGAGDPIPEIQLKGEGCGKAEEGVCELVSEGSREVLRDCSTTEDSSLSCLASEYELGSQTREGQYVLLKSESPFQIVTVYRVDPNTLEYSEVETHFYSPIDASCEDNQDEYEAACFSYPVSDIQREDIWRSNQGYLNALKEFGSK